MLPIVQFIWAFMPTKLVTKEEKQHIEYVVNTAFEDNLGLKVKKIEIPTWVSHVTYQYEVKVQLTEGAEKILTEKNPDTDYYFIIGADMVDYLPKWYRIDELVDLVQFVGVQRPRYKAGTSYPVIWVDVPLMDISSSTVRAYIKKDRTPNFMVPQSVLAYIKKAGLYK